MKPILVTGGAQGLGAAICRQLAADGHDVVIHYRSSAPQAENLCQECRQHGIQAEIISGDFSNQQTLFEFIAHYTKLFSQTKGLVNNVGNFLIAPPQKTAPEDWLSLFQTNFFAPVFITQALLPTLKSIVNLGVSGLEARRTFTQTTAYAATKEALRFYTTSLAKELAPQHIRINMISPGYMENAIDLTENTYLPMHRPATLLEVARIVARFFDPSTDYITGQNLEISGGFGL